MLSLSKEVQTILSGAKIEGGPAQRVRTFPLYASNMNTQRKPSAFSQMNKANTPRSDSGGYRAWKQKEKEVKKELNPASFTEFPDLVKSAPKKSVFEGASLATKLKEAIAAEEEEVLQKRLKKGVTPETILREMCVCLPLKNYKGPTSEPLEIPSWVTDNTTPFSMPPFRPKTMKQQADERRWRRLGINPYDLTLEDETSYEDDKVSLPSEDFERYAEEEVGPQEELCEE